MSGESEKLAFINMCMTWPRLRPDILAPRLAYPEQAPLTRPFAPLVTVIPCMIETILWRLQL